ncbi:transcriptional regulator of arginine metabolism [Trueperella bonasi]|uniref:Arginine repressor n=1 Tax=Trueperella bonasi TaxID=312286 RepID=A0ABT9NDV9_9ACTO|nr:arginine repressor [Trueperella bonasi]MDP9805580.1 transcriptional regulator of arginine metabolism [Trueperella bonasi]
MSTISTRAARLSRIATIVESRVVTSQDELRQILADEGIAVTQATLSRDLDELQARKVPSADGKRAYWIPAPGIGGERETGADANLNRWAREVMVSAQAAQNQLVLRTPPGAAQLLASALDRALLRGVLGCIAGDDTVLVITENNERAKDLLNDLINIAQAQPSNN